MMKISSSSELPIIFDDNLKTKSVSFLTAELSLLSCKCDSFTFSIESFYVRLRITLFYNIFTILLQFLVKSPK